MSSKRSGMEWKNLNIFLGFLLIYAARISFGLTNPSDENVGKWRKMEDGELEIYHCLKLEKQAWDFPLQVFEEIIHGFALAFFDALMFVVLVLSNSYDAFYLSCGAMYLIACIALLLLVAAINSLYAALGSPLLPGWIASGGDPCAEAWQGVQCNGSDIMSMWDYPSPFTVGTSAAFWFVSMSNDGRFVGSLNRFEQQPDRGKYSIQFACYYAKLFSGSIPDSLSSLTMLTDMSLNNNNLSGEIPDAFQSLSGLINLDLSSNKLSGSLPPSMENLSSLTTLRLQANQLSGTLDVLQDLPLRDLNIENNLFNGPIPEKMLSIPSFKNDGNPFNSTVAPLPGPTSPLAPPHAPPHSVVPASGQTPTSDQTPGKHADGPSASEGSNSSQKKNFLTTKRVVWISIASVLLFIILALALLLFMPKCSRGREEAGGIFKRHQVGAYRGNRENLVGDAPLTTTASQTEK
ncbi:hypothetical protein Golax_010946, partial [Gossypium laxum]|nr:hypothetical protein [Gossypium laxum]